MSAPNAWRIARSADGVVSIARGDGFDLSTAMVGATVEAAPELAARLHAVCPNAHRIGTSAALGARVLEADREALALETASAAGLRLGMFWPMAFNARPNPAAAAAIAAAKRGDPAALAGALEDLLAASASLDIGSRAEKLLAGFGDPEQPGAALKARFSAMRAQTLALIDELRSGAISARVHATRGHARVETLRGPLEVKADAADGVVTAFCVVTPTDRLMQENGPIASVCAQARDAEAARLAILALDPCAAFTLEFAERRADA